MIKESLRVLICFKRPTVSNISNILQKQGNAVPNVDQKSESSNPVNWPFLKRAKLNEESDCDKKEQYLKIDAYMLKFVMIIIKENSSLPRKNSQ